MFRPNRATQCLITPLLFAGSIAASPALASSVEWTPLLSSLHDLLVAPAGGPPRQIRVVGTSGLSWPDGRQAIATTIEVRVMGKVWLQRCFDYYDKNMVATGHVCHELRPTEASNGQ